MKKLIATSILRLLCMTGVSCGKNVTVTVVGEDGKPVQGVKVAVWSIGSNKSKDQKFEGRTNNEGVASVEVSVFEGAYDLDGINT